MVLANILGKVKQCTVDSLEKGKDMGREFGNREIKYLILLKDNTSMIIKMVMGYIDGVMVQFSRVHFSTI
jgi:hypothetical protein